MHSDKALKVGIIGYGLAGRIFHAPLIAATKGLEVAAIVTRSQAASARADFPEAMVLESAEQLFSRSAQLDFVVIATPNDSHVPLAIASLRAGLPVVVDKPAALNSAQMLELMAVAQESRLMLSIFQNRRWDGDFLTLQGLVNSGQLGKLLRFESRFERYRTRPKPGGWRETTRAEDGGGILLDLGSHLIDQALVLLGRPQSVWAEIKQRRPGVDGDDDVFLALQFADDISAHLWMSMLAPSPGARLKMTGWSGSFEKWGLDGQEEALRSGLRPGQEAWGPACSGEKARLILAGDDGLEETEIAVRPGDYLSYYQSIQRSLVSSGTLPPPVKAEEALATLAVIEAARLSVSSGRTIHLNDNK